MATINDARAAEYAARKELAEYAVTIVKSGAAAATVDALAHLIEALRVTDRAASGS